MTRMINAPLKNQIKKVTQPAIRRLKPAPSIPSKPVSANYGAERGTPVSRHYIDKFMETHRDDIAGAVLEIKNPRYTNSLGTNLEKSDILDVDASNPDANIITDLATADCVPSSSYDCFMINETLQFVYDLPAAVRHSHRILRPGGVLLVTVPCTAQHDVELGSVEQWRFTRNSCERLFGDVFGKESVQVETYGSFASCVAGLSGMAIEELDPRMLEIVSPQFVQGVCVRAEKTTDSVEASR